MEKTQQSPKQIAVVLERAEALVLFECLARQEHSFQGGAGSVKLSYPAEGVALSNLLCLLEKQLAEPFAQNGSYPRLIEEARAELLKR